MKTAISIPDDIFAAAEATARRLGMSRSELFSRAVAIFIEKHQGRRITAQLDKVYGDHDSKLDPALNELQLQSIGARKKRW
jgi:metal-responsive CopG/Arc/MetJ family transcriptional regulator